MNNRIKFASLFTGIGAPEKAFKELGIELEHVGFCENHEETSKAFSFIHNLDESLNLGDVTAIDWDSVPDFDLLWYSPPCQSFSRQGKELGMEDERGILFFDALKGIKAKRPKIAIMENVDNLAGKKFKDEFNIMLERLEELDYTNYHKVLNASDYNVAQNRKRIFIISIRNDLDITYEFPKALPLTNSLSDYLEKDAEPTILHNIYGGFKEKCARVFKKHSPTIRTAAGGGHIPSVVLKDSKRIIKENKLNKQNKLFYIEKDEFLIEDDKYYLEKEGVQEGRDYVVSRQMTPRETFRLQGFSDEDFDKVKDHFKDTLLYRMSGNSIPVPMLKELLKPLFK